VRGDWDWRRCWLSVAGSILVRACAVKGLVDCSTVIDVRLSVRHSCGHSDGVGDGDGSSGCSGVRSSRRLGGSVVRLLRSRAARGARCGTA
jgi:hypothetical protein